MSRVLVEEMGKVTVGSDVTVEEDGEEVMEEKRTVNVPDDVEVVDIAAFNNWDARECRVGNADAWKAAIREYLELNNSAGQAPIPRHIHQIWVGPKEPPCVWLDSWSVEFVNKFPEWEYTLWTDEQVAELPMINQDLYDQERMYQCKADILRLEILYKHGGVYIDADVVSLLKSLDEVLNSADDTKFVISYEPDTKDKPYSVIGNSIIAVTPQHPLILMLIKYIRNIYPHKRPHHGVEWVTGPLAFTKVLIHADMPFTRPPTHYFYPQFHYIPNPDAISLNAFPDSLAFQFGYTCSGLEGWVAANNRCRRATKCPVHRRKTDWEFGRFRPFPSASSSSSSDTPPNDRAGAGTKVVLIHQFDLRGGDGQRPERWMSGWRSSFGAAAAREWATTGDPTPIQYEYKLWTLGELLNGEYFCVNVYRRSRPMDATALTMLALELLYDHGGVYIPSSTVYDPTYRTLPPFATPTQSHSLSSISTVGGAGAYGNGAEDSDRLKAFPGGILSATRGSASVVEALKALYDGEQVESVNEYMRTPSVSMEKVGVESVGGEGDALAAYIDFPTWTRWLPLELIINAVPAANATLSNVCDEVLLSWSYDSNVPCVKPPPHPKSNAIQLVKFVLNESGGVRCIVVTDGEFARLRVLRDAVPAMVAELDEKCGEGGWKAMVLCCEWGCEGESGISTYQPAMGVRAPNAVYPAVILNKHDSARALFGSHGNAISVVTSEVFVDAVLEKHGACGGVWVGVHKLQHSRELSEVYTSLHTIQYAFEKLANHAPPMELLLSGGGFVEDMGGGGLKVFRDEERNSLVLEVRGEGEGRVMFRAWNDDGGLNCECKLSRGPRSDVVEWMRVYYNHQVVFDGHNKPI
eukprot:CAMPEP_0185843942 /NCGR_PEP_ID=MMETSP1354-20130828/297_1 /TAXON_ID=708628 /ORGANISM="Erythrolobus madagascarensis, Strain CCMP3276" /LENGTH=863 /DNA_ID=CAMNT_0028543537 /DNA_START=60 /DNA_END=2651 /DNA_ORIENTATION=-